MEAKQFLVEFVQVISVGQPSTARENCPATRGPAGKWTQARAGERHRKTSEPRIQSWRRPAVARAGGGGAKRPTQREAPRARSRAVSVRTSAKGANARSAGGRASASTSASGANARSAGEQASASTSAKGADARSAGGRASASTSARGPTARIAECKPKGVEMERWGLQPWSPCTGRRRSAKRLFSRCRRR